MLQQSLSSSLRPRASSALQHLRHPNSWSEDVASVQRHSKAHGPVALDMRQTYGGGLSLSQRPTSIYRPSGAKEQEWGESAHIVGETESGAEPCCSEPLLGYLGSQGLLRTQLGVCLQ